MGKIYKFTFNGIPLDKYLEMQPHKTEILVLKQDCVTFLFNKTRNEIYFLNDSDSENKDGSEK